ncbi:MAG: SDR family NAD(P)-dependent oxidoreductase [Sulfitobacter sp.]
MNYLDNLFSLKGRHALVTGGSSGLGAEMAWALANAGAEVTLVARRTEQLNEMCDRISRSGGVAHAISADLVAPDAIATLAAQLKASSREIDIVVNAAGINLRRPADEVTRAEWDASIALNLTVPFFLAQAFVSDMATRGWGRVINIGSLQSVRAFAHSAAYGATKGGIVQLTRAMAEAWSPAGITCNAIAPGLFPTELTHAVFADDDAEAAMADRTCVRRNGQLTDIHGLAVYLTSDASAFMTGQTLFLDGGFTAK